LPPPCGPPRLEICENIKCDALIVGAGITGSLVAERLTCQASTSSLSIANCPAACSTAASTSMLLLGDRPLA
jgi:hypothetical protein